MNFMITLVAIQLTITFELFGGGGGTSALPMPPIVTNPSHYLLKDVSFDDLLPPDGGPGDFGSSYKRSEIGGGGGGGGDADAKSWMMDQMPPETYGKEEETAEELNRANLLLMGMNSRFKQLQSFAPMSATGSPVLGGGIGASSVKPRSGSKSHHSQQIQFMTPTGGCTGHVDTSSELENETEAAGSFFGYILTGISWLIIIFTFPFSMCFCLKVIKEYERVVIFRLGRLMTGAARGPGMIFLVPCIDNYRKIDLRVASYAVPPQEILSKGSIVEIPDNWQESLDTIVHSYRNPPNPQTPPHDQRQSSPVCKESMSSTANLRKHDPDRLVLAATASSASVAAGSVMIISGGRAAGGMSNDSGLITDSSSALEWIRFQRQTAQVVQSPRVVQTGSPRSAAAMDETLFPRGTLRALKTEADRYTELLNEISLKKQQQSTEMAAQRSKEGAMDIYGDNEAFRAYKLAVASLSLAKDQQTEITRLNAAVWLGGKNGCRNINPTLVNSSASDVEMGRGNYGTGPSTAAAPRCSSASQHAGIGHISSGFLRQQQQQRQQQQDNQADLGERSSTVVVNDGAESAIEIKSNNGSNGAGNNDISNPQNQPPIVIDSTKYHLFPTPPTDEENYNNDIGAAAVLPPPPPFVPFLEYSAASVVRDSGEERQYGTGGSGGLMSQERKKTQKAGYDDDQTLAGARRAALGSGGMPPLLSPASNHINENQPYRHNSALHGIIDYRYEADNNAFNDPDSLSVVTDASSSSKRSVDLSERQSALLKSAGEKLTLSWMSKDYYKQSRHKKKKKEQELATAARNSKVFHSESSMKPERPSTPNNRQRTPSRIVRNRTPKTSSPIKSKPSALRSATKMSAPERPREFQQQHQDRNRQERRRQFVAAVAAEKDVVGFQQNCPKTNSEEHDRQQERTNRNHLQIRDGGYDQNLDPSMMQVQKKRSPLNNNAGEEGRVSSPPPPPPVVLQIIHLPPAAPSSSTPVIVTGSRHGGDAVVNHEWNAIAAAAAADATNQQQPPSSSLAAAKNYHPLPSSSSLAAAKSYYPPQVSSLAAATNYHPRPSSSSSILTGRQLIRHVGNIQPSTKTNRLYNKTNKTKSADIPPRYKNRQKNHPPNPSPPFDILPVPTQSSINQTGRKSAAPKNKEKEVPMNRETTKQRHLDEGFDDLMKRLEMLRLDVARENLDSSDALRTGGSDPPEHVVLERTRRIHPFQHSLLSDETDAYGDKEGNYYGIYGKHRVLPSKSSPAVVNFKLEDQHRTRNAGQQNRKDYRPLSSIACEPILLQKSPVPPERSSVEIRSRRRRQAIHDQNLKPPKLRHPTAPLNDAAGCGRRKYRRSLSADNHMSSSNQLNQAPIPPDNKHAPKSATKNPPRLPTTSSSLLHKTQSEQNRLTANKTRGKGGVTKSTLPPVKSLPFVSSSSTSKSHSVNVNLQTLLATLKATNPQLAQAYLSKSDTSSPIQVSQLFTEELNKEIKKWSQKVDSQLMTYEKLSDKLQAAILESSDRVKKLIASKDRVAHAVEFAYDNLTNFRQQRAMIQTALLQFSSSSCKPANKNYLQSASAAIEGNNDKKNSSPSTEENEREVEEDDLGSSDDGSSGEEEEVDAKRQLLTRMRAESGRDGVVNGRKSINSRNNRRRGGINKPTLSSILHQRKQKQSNAARKDRNKRLIDLFVGTVLLYIRPPSIRPPAVYKSTQFGFH